MPQNSNFRIFLRQENFWRKNMFAHYRPALQTLPRDLFSKNICNENWIKDDIWREELAPKSPIIGAICSARVVGDRLMISTPSSLFFLSSFDCVLFVYCWYGCQRREFFNGWVASPSAGREAAGEYTVRWSGGGLIFTFGRPPSLYPLTLRLSFEDSILFLTQGK